MRTEWELNCLIAGLSDSIIDHIYSDMQSAETLPDNTDGLTIERHIDVTA